MIIIRKFVFIKGQEMVLADLPTAIDFMLGMMNLN